VAASVKVGYRVTGKSWSGSGVVFASSPAGSYIVTNKHVVPRAGLVEITFPGGRHLPARFVAADSKADLACVAIAGTAPAVQLADAVPRAGAPVWQVGYPMGRGPVSRAGRVVGFSGWTETGADVFGLELLSGPGTSGSGVFTRPEGRLCALVWGGNVEMARTVCVGLDDLRRFTAQCLRPRVPLLPIRRPPVVIVTPGAPVPVPPPAPAAPVEPPVVAPPPPPPPPAPSAPTVPPDYGKEIRDSLDRVIKGVEGLKPPPGVQAPVPLPLPLKPAPPVPGPQGPVGPAGLPGTPAPLDRLEKLERAAGKALEIGAAVAPLAGWAGSLPTLATVGAVGGPAGVGLALLALLVRRRATAAAAQPAANPAQVLVGLPPQVGLPPVPMQPQVIVTPGQATTHSTYVPVPQPNAELDALKQALDLMVQRNPGAQATVEALKSYAAQIQSGGKK
jgi:hypothetical protein